MIDDEENGRTPPKLGSYWENHPVGGTHHPPPLPSRFPSGLGKSLGHRGRSWWLTSLRVPSPPASFQPPAAASKKAPGLIKTHSEKGKHNVDHCQIIDGLPPLWWEFQCIGLYDATQEDSHEPEKIRMKGSNCFLVGKIWHSWCLWEKRSSKMRVAPWETCL